jgi:hypothetical protein
MLVKSSSDRFGNWIIVFETDADFEAAGDVATPADETDLMMAAKGYTRYSYNDLLYETDNIYS